MNRETRRKNGISKENAERLEQLNSPCTVMEAVQLAQGVTEDAISNYHKSINPIIVSLSIQVEVLKELLFKQETPILNEEKFLTMFQERVDDYNKQRAEALNSFKEEQLAQEADDIVEESDVKTNVTPFPVQVEVSK